MAFIYLIFNIFIFFTSSVYTQEIISCSQNNLYSIEESGSKYDIFLQGLVNVTYGRYNLSIYTYDNIKFANFLLSDVNIIFNGFFSNSSNRRPLSESIISCSLKTDIEGIAEHSKYDDYGRLLNTKLDLKKNLKHCDECHQVVREKIVDVAHICIETKLAEKLGGATPGDYLRAKTQDHDFGENSVMYKAFHDHYPMLDGLQKTEKPALQLTLNLMADFLLASMVTQFSGQRIGWIDLPERNEVIPGKFLLKDGSFKITNMSLGDLTTLRRIEDIEITNRGLEFKLKTGVGLSKARVTSLYDVYYNGASSRGEIEINLDNVQCFITVSLNYNRKPCVSTLENIHIEPGKLDFTLDRSSSTDKVINYVVNKVLHPFVGKIIQTAESKINEVVGNLLKNFSCEKFRPA